MNLHELECGGEPSGLLAAFLRICYDDDINEGEYDKATLDAAKAWSEVLEDICLLCLDRENSCGSETEHVGFFEYKQEGMRLFYLNAIYSCDLFFSKVYSSSKEVPDCLKSFLTETCDYHQPQIASCDVDNLRPSLLSRDHVKSVIDYVARFEGWSWEDYDSCDAFMEARYSER